MSKYTFIYEYGDETKIKITHEVEIDTLQEALDAFNDFLLGCGFRFDGKVEVVEEMYEGL